VLCAVALGPWLPVIALIVAPFWWLIRRWTRATRQANLPVLEVAPAEQPPQAAP
jgi:hypothetical protein